MKTEKQEYESLLKNYLPLDYIDVVVNLLLKHSVKFKIVKARKTKLGDFRTGIKNDLPIITINKNLNKYSFLITTLHEFAHLINWKINGNSVPPHGKEWKKIYSKLLIPIIKLKKLPLDIEDALEKGLNNIKASSCSDIHLSRVLMKYDENPNNEITLEKINKNSTFVLNGKTFLKGELRRTRYLCLEKKSNKKYLINRLIRVNEIKDE